MRFDQKQFFDEKADATVNGFTIIEVDRSGEKYRIAEKWQRNDGSSWQTYWIEQDRLLTRIEQAKCEPVGKLTDEQFEKVCQKADPRLVNDLNEKAPA